MRSISFKALCAIVFAFVFAMIVSGCVATSDDSKMEIGNATFTHLQATNGFGARISRDRVKIPVGAYGTGYGYGGVGYAAPDSWQLAAERSGWTGGYPSAAATAPQQTADAIDKDGLVTCAKEMKSGKLSSKCLETFQIASKNSQVRDSSVRKCFAAIGAAKRVHKPGSKDTYSYDYESTPACDAVINKMAKASAEAE